MAGEDRVTATLTGFDLGWADLVALADGADAPHVDPAALARVERAQDVLVAAAGSGAVYGATTGVGANRTVGLDAADTGQALRLWRSAVAGIGPAAGPRLARATMIVRLNQLLAGGAGVGRTLVEGLLSAVADGRTAVIHDAGAVGTGDLGALSELALALVGERPWSDGAVHACGYDRFDGLPFISSSAVTLARTADALARLERVLSGMSTITGLSFLAMRGSTDPFLAATSGEAGDAAAAVLTVVLPDPHGAVSAARVQDPFGLRAFPQVHGSALEALGRVGSVLDQQINGSHENPTVEGGVLRHNGRFHLARLALALDGARTALVATAALSSGRISTLLDPAITGLAPFLSDGSSGSSGLMLCEYVAEDALAELRLLASPVSGASVSMSHGVEEHAPFATQAARALERMIEGLTTVAAVELLAAHRALRLAPERVTTEPARRVMAGLDRILSPGIHDRTVDLDARAALDLVALLPSWAADPDGASR